jgi:hypothetical protein
MVVLAFLQDVHDDVLWSYGSKENGIRMALSSFQIFVLLLPSSNSYFS